MPFALRNGADECVKQDETAIQATEVKEQVSEVFCRHVSSPAVKGKLDMIWRFSRSMAKESPSRGKRGEKKEML